MKPKLILTTALVLGILAALIISVAYGTSGYDGKTINGLQTLNSGEPNHLANKAYQNLDHVIDVRDYGATGNGTDNDYDELAAAVTAAGNSGGVVYLPEGTYLIGGSTWAIPKGVSVVGDGNTVTVKYTGQDDAVTLVDGNYFCRLENFNIETTQADANGIRIGVGARECVLRNLVIFSDVVATNAASGIFVDARTGGWTGLLTFTDTDVAGYKHGIRLDSGNLATNTVTTVSCWRVGVTGYSSGPVSGSTGFSFDAETNGIGTIFLGGTIESFATGISHANGGYGGWFACDLENNTTNWSVGASFSGEIRDPTNGNYLHKGTNGTANVWYQEEADLGEMVRESRYNQKHVIYQGSSDILEWGYYRGASIVDGGSPTAKFKVVCGGAADVNPRNNYIWFGAAGRKLTFDSAAPTGSAGTFDKGDVCLNSSPDPGEVFGWICTTAGTFGTLVGVTADTTATSADITVNDASSLVVGQYITIAGVTGTKKITVIVGTTVTVDVVCDATVNDGAVAWNTPVFSKIGAIESANAYTTSNVTTDRAFDADATSDAEMADVLATLIEDLKSAGVLKSP